MDNSPVSGCRPTPKFFEEPLSFSTKKERNMTPRDRPPPPLRPSTKRVQVFNKVFSKKNSSRALAISFVTPNQTITTPHYNPNKEDSFFEQCFEKICKLGSGSFGDVYKVRSKEDGLYYAVKRSKQKFKSKIDKKKKLEEVDKHEKLPPHTNCVKYIKAWEEKKYLFIQTELCRTSLGSYAESNHNIAEETVWNYLVDLLMGVKHLHDHNLVHMDIKPENVFISSDEICKLGDFGLVLDLNKKEEAGDGQEGDPKYLAPELMEGHFGKPADIFSLGITILELATDLDLPRGGELWHLLRSGQLPEDIFQDVSEELIFIIKWMLEPDAANRPTVDDVLEHQFVKETWIKRMQEQSMLPEVQPINKSPPKRALFRRISDQYQDRMDDVDAKPPKQSYNFDGGLSPLPATPIFSSDECLVDNHNISGITELMTPPSHTPQNACSPPHWNSLNGSTSPSFNSSGSSSKLPSKVLPVMSSKGGLFEDDITTSAKKSATGRSSRTKNSNNNNNIEASPERKKLLF